MKNETMQEWPTVRAKIKKKFGKLTDTEINSLEGHMDRLPSKVRNAYSYDQSKAERECKAFNETLNR